jgi:hypothetical protein
MSNLSIPLRIEDLEAKGAFRLDTYYDWNLNWLYTAHYTRAELTEWRLDSVKVDKEWMTDSPLRNIALSVTKSLESLEPSAVVSDSE